MTFPHWPLLQSPIAIHFIIAKVFGLPLLNIYLFLACSHRGLSTNISTSVSCSHNNSKHTIWAFWISTYVWCAPKCIANIPNDRECISYIIIIFCVHLTRWQLHCYLKHWLRHAPLDSLIWVVRLIGHNCKLRKVSFFGPPNWHFQGTQWAHKVIYWFRRRLNHSLPFCYSPHWIKFDFI